MDSQEIRKRFIGTAVGDCFRAAEGRALTGSAILAFCVVDYIATLARPRKKRGKKKKSTGWVYKRAVTRYLNKLNKNYNKNEMWQLRNSLIHNYAASSNLHEASLDGFWLSHCTDDFHLRKVGKTLQIDVREFVADVSIAAWHFFQDVDRFPTKRRIVEKNSKMLFIVAENSAAVVGRSYESMHPALAAFDTNPVDFERLRRAVHALFKTDPQPARMDPSENSSVLTFTPSASGVTSA